MYRIDEKILDEFIYHGTDNLQELLEGIVFFSTNEMHNIYPSLTKQYETPNDIQLSQIKEIAYKYGIQYYRFIELNQTPNKFVDYKKLEYPNNIKKSIDQIIYKAIDEKSLIEYQVGYYLSNDIYNKFNSIYTKDYTLRTFWATEVAQQLKQLSIQEEEDPIEYYKTWITAKLNIAKNRRLYKDDSEIEFIKNVKMQLDEKIRQLKFSKENDEQTK